MKVYTYLIQSIKEKSYYTGISRHPQKRLSEHNQGKLKITAKKKPYRLVYLKEHNSYKEARRHEIWLKKKNNQYKKYISISTGSSACPAPLGGVK
ncbi:MAG: GIY-YIG nuclease family protein [Patescibacteria group bacterium]